MEEFNSVGAAKQESNCQKVFWNKHFWEFFDHLDSDSNNKIENSSIERLSENRMVSIDISMEEVKRLVLGSMSVNLEIDR